MSFYEYALAKTAEKEDADGLTPGKAALMGALGGSVPTIALYPSQYRNEMVKERLHNIARLIAMEKPLDRFYRLENILNAAGRTVRANFPFTAALGTMGGLYGLGLEALVHSGKGEG